MMMMMMMMIVAVDRVVLSQLWGKDNNQEARVSITLTTHHSQWAQIKV